MGSFFRVLLLSGSLRGGSTNSAALRTVAGVGPGPFETTFYEGMTTLPAFNPDADGDPLPREVAELRNDIMAADALLFSTRSTPVVSRGRSRTFWTGPSATSERGRSTASRWHG